MEIKDQIRSRREKLGMTMKELADRVGVTEQAVRHWEGGRSFPGKSKMRAVETALSFQLDWTEGTAPAGNTAAAMIDQQDVELLLVICKLPLKAKSLIGDFARMHLDAIEQSRRPAPEPTPPAPAPKPATQPKTKASPTPALAGSKRH